MALAAARGSPAQAASCPIPRADSALANARWAPPLDRLVTAHSADVSLRDAIDRVAAAAKLRMSYSAEFLPLNRAVCLNADALPVGRVLGELLSGTTVAAIGVGGDQVVLAPRREAPAQAAAPEMSPSVGVLDRVVVTGAGSQYGAPERELTVGLDVIDGRQLSRENSTTISDALDGNVPGVWSWAQSPTSLMSSYGSIRGASSFKLSYPKMYIDGIEVANPLLLARFNPSAVERIEVIRGPQGSALYGTDAISGVVNIVTRHEGAPAVGSGVSVRTTYGVSQNSYANVLATDHALDVVTGTSARSFDFHLSGGTIGSFIPDGHSSSVMASGGTRLVGSTSTFTATARFFMEQAGTPDSPLLARPPVTHDDSLRIQNDMPQSVHEYTVGATGTTAINDSWTMSLVAGVDGYRLTNVQADFAPIPTRLDSALRAAEGGAARATLRASSVYQFNAGAPTRATLTVSAEHSTLRVSTVPFPVTTTLRMGQPQQPQFARGWQASQTAAATDASRVVEWQNSTGFVAQTNAALNDVVFLTTGVRFEHDSRLAGVDQIETLPMVGLATVAEEGPFTVKLRGAYGRGIRPPTTPSRLQFWQTSNGPVAQAPLGPERQEGVEAGIDLLVKHAFSFQATRFDQHASGLIQPVGVPVDANSRSHKMFYVAQNVGVITNRGWELQGTANVSRLAVTGTMTFVDSRVANLASGYLGDLVAGDRMLQVPARTQSLNLTWTAPRWHLTFGGSRALNWINYDELALAQAWADDTKTAPDLTGARLRQFWRRYDGAAHLRAAASREYRNRFSFEISGENLLNHQSGEPDNITIIPGRTVMTGVQVKF